MSLIGISGGSGSGKTTFARALQASFGEGVCTILSQDSYYVDQSAHFKGDGENVNFDHPDALDFSILALQLKDLKKGHTIQVPIYDFVTHQRKRESLTFPPSPIVILDGTLILSQAEIFQQLDYSLFVDTPEEIRFARRLQRDVEERGRHPDGIRKQFLNQVKPMHDCFVEPSKSKATEVVSGLGDFNLKVQYWAKKLSQNLK